MRLGPAQSESQPAYLFIKSLFSSSDLPILHLQRLQLLRSCRLTHVFESTRLLRSSTMSIIDEIVKESHAITDEIGKINEALVHRHYLMKKNLSLTKFGSSVCALAVGTSVYLYLSSRESPAPAAVAAHAPASGTI